MAKKEFEESTVETLIERFGEKALKKYSFKTLYDAVLNVIDLQSLAPEKRTAKLESLINIFESEKRRLARINDWIKKKNQAS